MCARPRSEYKCWPGDVKTCTGVDGIIWTTTSAVNADGLGSSMRAEVLAWLQDREACLPVRTPGRQLYTDTAKNLEAGNSGAVVPLLQDWRAYWQRIAESDNLAAYQKADAEAWVKRFDAWLEFLRVQ